MRLNTSRLGLQVVTKRNVQFKEAINLLKNLQSNYHFYFGSQFYLLDIISKRSPKNIHIFYPDTILCKNISCDDLYINVYKCFCVDVQYDLEVIINCRWFCLRFVNNLSAGKMNIFRDIIRTISYVHGQLDITWV